MYYSKLSDSFKFGKFRVNVTRLLARVGPTNSSKATGAIVRRRANIQIFGIQMTPICCNDTLEISKKTTKIKKSCSHQQFFIIKFAGSNLFDNPLWTIKSNVFHKNDMSQYKNYQFNGSDIFSGAQVLQGHPECGIGVWPKRVSWNSLNKPGVTRGIEERWPFFSKTSPDWSLLGLPEFCR